MMGAPSVAPRSKGSRMRRTPATAQHLFAHASTDRPITVVLADDHPATREGLRHALASVDTVRVIGVATVGAEAVSLVRELTPDIVLLDLQMPQGDGLWVLGQLRALGSSARVVMLTAYGGDAQIAAALNAGAVGYLQKDIAIPQLIECIRAVALGHRVFSPAIADRLQGHVGFLVNVQAGGLTPREREVLHLLAAGTRYRGIAQQLSISEATVKFHVLNLYQKLQSSSRVEALNRAREWGLFA
jgi:DNA-binding NarL/FixJ family response regulator